MQNLCCIIWIANDLINLIYLLLLIFLPQSMRDLNSLTRDASHAPGVEVQSLNLWTTREVPNYYFLTEFYICIKCKITRRKQSKIKPADSCSSFSMSASQRETLSTLLVDFFLSNTFLSLSGIRFLLCVFSYDHVLSLFSHVQLFVTLGTIACQLSLSMGFSRQKYWSGLPCPPPGDLPDPGTEPTSFYVSCIGRFVLYH